MEAKTFGLFLAECRKEKNMTQAELAEKLHVTAAVVAFALIVLWQRDFLDNVCSAIYYTILERLGVYSHLGDTLSLPAVVLDVTFLGDLFWCSLACLFGLFVPVPSRRKKKGALGQEKQHPSA